MSEARPDPVQRFFGAALIAIGVLMMVLCGGCGAIIFLFYVFDGLAHPNDMSMAIIPIFVGGVPALIGLGLFAGGRALRGGPKPPPRTEPPAGDA